MMKNQDQKTTNQQTQSKQHTQNTAHNSLGQSKQPATYWREQYKNEPYYTQGEKFEQYEPAYRTGIEGRQQYAGQRFDEVESNLRNDYETNIGSSTMSWEPKGKQACRAAWDYLDQNQASGTDRQQSQRQSSDRQSQR